MHTQIILTEKTNSYLSVIIFKYWFTFHVPLFFVFPSLSKIYLVTFTISYKNNSLFQSSCKIGMAFFLERKNDYCRHLPIISPNKNFSFFSILSIISSSVLNMHKFTDRVHGTCTTYFHYYLMERRLQ